MPSRQFVVQHGITTKRGPVPSTRWQDSKLPFTPRPVSNRKERYATTAHAQCTVCGGEFVYKEHRPANKQPVRISLGSVLAIVVVGLCLGQGQGLLLIMAFGVIALPILALMSMPEPTPEPHFQQLKGATVPGHQHRVRPLK